MQKSKKSLKLNRETVRQLNITQLKGVGGGWIPTAEDGCLSTSYHGGACNSGQQSCDALCTSSLSG